MVVMEGKGVTVTKLWATAETDHSMASGNRKGQGNGLHVTEEMWHQGKQRTPRHGVGASAVLVTTTS